MRSYVPALSLFVCALAAAQAEPGPAGFASVHEAVAAAKGAPVFLPAGEWRISEPVVFRGAGGGLHGHGTLIQENPDAPILRIDGAENVRIEGITLCRPPDTDAAAPGILVENARDIVIRGVTVRGNRAREGAVEVRDSVGCRIEDCEILDYKRVAVDDRTGPSEIHYGYAFKCIDGTGIVARGVEDLSIVNNRVVERRLMPTRVMKELHGLGNLTEGRHPTQPGDLAQGVVERGYVNNWHQGSAILVTDPEKSRFIRVTGNYIENAAQGIDLHCDHAVVTGNTVNRGMMGIKMTHGCRNLIVSDNLLSRIDLWGILMNPGAASHAAEPAAEGREARPANVDGGTVIANNIITDYGHGNEYWNWGGATDDQGGSYALAFYEGQLPENPPLRDVVVTGNMVYDTGRDGVPEDGKIATPAPRYRWAVYIGAWGKKDECPTCPQGLRFSNNLFHPGTQGVSNVPLEP